MVKNTVGVISSKVPMTSRTSPDQVRRSRISPSRVKHTTIPAAMAAQRHLRNRLKGLQTWNSTRRPTKDRMAAQTVETSSLGRPNTAIKA